MVYILGPNRLIWSLVGGGVVYVDSRRFFTHHLRRLIDTSEQLMSQRHRILPPGVSSSDTLQAYSLKGNRK